MDCNSYSYTAPDFGVNTPHNYNPINTVTIERKTNAKGQEYYTIKALDGWNIAHSIESAISTAKEWLKEGV